MIQERSIKFIQMGQILLNNLGVILIVGLLWLAILTYFLYAIFTHYQRVIKKSDGAGLKQLLDKLLDQSKKTDQQLSKIEKTLAKIEQEDLQHLQKVSLVRFNPFEDVGGQQSFTAAFLDGQNSGIVISSLHSRSGTRIYTKLVENGKSKDSDLSAEEQKAVETAIRSG